MSTPKPLASLSPGLLARKGAARPAMRPHLQPLQQFHDATARQLNEDLGWNDMGEDHVAPYPVQLTPEPRPEPSPVAQAPEAAPAEPPAVVRLQAQVAERVAAPVKRRSALAEGRRAAFTLRLDAERHRELRLACAVASNSAQQLVTQALDRLLADMSEAEALSEQVRKRGGNS